ncbi:hypothetical protein HER21_37330, partial [Pseudomonas sp. BGM005]|nr:hypothetical protein [Pseudomonas sp. BG5]
VALTAVQALVPSAKPVVVEPIDWTSESESENADDDEPETANAYITTPASDAEEAADEGDEAQKGSSGSTATATKISVK